MDSSPASNLIFNQFKAGLGAVDPQAIADRITEVSRNTKYYACQVEHAKSIDAQSRGMLDALRGTSAAELRAAGAAADSYVSKLRQRLSFERAYLHADLDAFYASVEQLDDASLAGAPFVVGGSIKHGVVSTSSYAARRYGVRSGMAIFIALSLCPDLRIVPFHGEKYVEKSREVQQIFRRYDPDFSSLGLDEASLDVTELLRTSGMTPEEVAAQLQREVFEETKLTISIGIAHTRQLAKIASDINKPNGIFAVPRNEAELSAFLSSLKIRKIPGIGGVTERKLHALNVETIQDVLDKKAEIWVLFSQKFREFIFHSAIGIPMNKIANREKRKSLGKECTFSGTDDLVVLMDYVELMGYKISKKLQREGISCRTVTVRFKSVDFVNYSKSYSFIHYTNKTNDIVNGAIKILMEEHQKEHMKLRLIGVRVNNFLYPGEFRQKTIFECDLTPRNTRTIQTSDNNLDKKNSDNKLSSSNKKMNGKLDYFLTQSYLDTIKTFKVENDYIKIKPKPIVPFSFSKIKKGFTSERTFPISTFFS